MLRIKDKLLILHDGTEVNLMYDDSLNVEILLDTLDYHMVQHSALKERIVLEDTERNEYKQTITSLNNRITHLETKLANKNWQRIPSWIKKLFGIHNLSPIV